MKRDIQLFAMNRPPRRSIAAGTCGSLYRRRSPLNSPHQNITLINTDTRVTHPSPVDMIRNVIFFLARYFGINECEMFAIQLVLVDVVLMFLFGLGNGNDRGNTSMSCSFTLFFMLLVFFCVVLFCECLDRFLPLRVVLSWESSNRRSAASAAGSS